MRSVLHSNRVRALMLVLISVVVSGRGLRAQETIATDESGEVSRPYPCWTGVMEFYSNWPYFEHGGYLFDANPFVVVQYREGNTAMIMVSSKGWRIVDASRRMIWTDPRIYVQCRVISYPWGYNRTFAVVVREMGTMEDCDSGPNTSPLEIGYDPYYETGGDDEDSCSPDAGSSGDPPTAPQTVCNTEWMAIDISYDGGVTWTTLWEGLVKVCR